MDQSVLFYLNKLAAESGLSSTIITALAENPLLRGGPVFLCIFYLWFSANDVRVKVRFITAFMACILGVVISVFCQSHLSLHVRPIYDNRLHLANILNWNMDSTANRIYSFPSDTATLYYALVSIVFLENKKLGLISFLWTTLTVGICRVATGVHYPSDIVAGIILGGGLVLLFSCAQKLNTYVSKLVLKHDPNFLFLNIFLALFCIEAYSLFPGLTQIFYFFVQLIKGLHF